MVDKFAYIYQNYLYFYLLNLVIENNMFFTILNLRSEFEDISADFNMPVFGSDINTLQWFAENGFRSNRLRNGYDRAIEIASIILAEYNNGRTHKGRDKAITEDY